MFGRNCICLRLCPAAKQTCLRDISLDLTLANEKYTGAYLYSPKMEENRGKRREKPNAIRIENALPVIIDRATFMEMQTIMNERKQTGRKADYLCSGLVYCRCGAKMHALKTHRKGHKYIYYACSAKCGAHTLQMEDVDRAAIKYLHELLSEDNQRSIAKAMREYQAGEGSRMEEFWAVLQKRVGEKQSQYEALMKNLSSGELPAEVVADIGAQMKQLKGEIAAMGGHRAAQRLHRGTDRAIVIIFQFLSLHFSIDFPLSGLVYCAYQPI